MFIVNSYTLAIIFCIVTMICWGSWGNTQKLAGKTWRYELFYWDYVIGILLLSLIVGFTLGSHGTEGRPFLTDLCQVETAGIISAIIGGFVFNASNILLSASTSLAGMSVAFPLGVGLALVIGVFVNYFATPKGDPITLFAGVALIVVALVFNGMAAAKNGSQETANRKKGIILAFVAGVLMSLFYRFVAAAMDLDCFESPMAGKATPYTAFFLFSIGVFISNFIFNTFVMKKPFAGEPVSYSTYFKGSFPTHLIGVLGGIIWGLGTIFSYIAAGKAGPAVSYALGQGAPMIAAFLGIFVWKEFTGASRKTMSLLAFMFIFFISGLALIVISGGN
ncbi:MAG: multidrug DMT transporter permease [Bacteroidales bacterium]|nr:multidrug DMT transporter permease [Candidatus Sodaliphilus aphodohippi]